MPCLGVIQTRFGLLVAETDVPNLGQNHTQICGRARGRRSELGGRRLEVGRVPDLRGAAKPDCVACMVLRKVSLGRPFHTSTSALGHATQTPPPPSRRQCKFHPGRWAPSQIPRSTFPRGVAISHAESSTPRPDGRALGKRAGVSVPRSPNLLVSLRGGAARNNVVGVVGISPSYKKLS